MNDLEFRKRAYCNPFDETADFVEASESTPERSRFMEDLRRLDKRVGDIVNTTLVPADLAEKLKQLVASDVMAATNASTGNNPRVVKKVTPRYMALAASLVVAVGLTLSLLPSSGPSAQDIEFHDHMLSHIYLEEPRFGESTTISWQQVNEVIESNGGHLKEDDRTRALRIKFVKQCGLSIDEQAVHIVLEGSKGAVSVLLVKGSAVSSTFPLKDQRFAGRFIPLGTGTLVIVGEKDEPLDGFQKLITENFEWDI
jgi:hypothetical protein